MPTGRFVRAWAVLWAVLTGLLFTSVTVLTLVVWIAAPDGAATNPVLDVSFFALGAMLAVGFASQVRRRSSAGIAQTLVAAASLGTAGLMGQRIEPAVGGLLLFLVAAVLLLGRRPRSRPAAHPEAAVPLALAVILAAVPSAIHAAGMVGAARAAGPSCFLGRCATGDRLAEAAAVVMAILLTAAVAAAGCDGWAVCCWSAGLAAVLVGAVSLALPAQIGSWGTLGGSGAVLWGSAVIVIGRRGRISRTTSRERTLA